MKCLECEGKGFIEYESGTIMVGCEACNGTGEIDSNSDKPRYLIIPEALPGKTLDETVDIARKLIEGNDDSNSRIGQPDSDIGSNNPSQSELKPKPKTKKKATKRAK